MNEEGKNLLIRESINDRVHGQINSITGYTTRAAIVSATTHIKRVGNERQVGIITLRGGVQAVLAVLMIV